MSANEAVRNRLVSALASGTLTEEDVAAEMRKLRERAAAPEARTAALDSSAMDHAARRPRLEAAGALLRRLGPLLDELDRERRQSLVRLLVDRVVVTSLVGEGGRRYPHAEVRYLFGGPGLVDCEYSGKPLYSQSDKLMLVSEHDIKRQERSDKGRARPRK